MLVQGRWLTSSLSRRALRASRQTRSSLVRARAIRWFQVGAGSFCLRAVSSAAGFDQACRFAALLTGIRIFDKLK